MQAEGDLEAKGVHLQDLGCTLETFRTSVATPYLNAVVKALQTRFPVLPVLESLSLFKPCIMELDTLASHGNAELDRLLDVIGKAQELEDGDFPAATCGCRGGSY